MSQYCKYYKSIRLDPDGHFLGGCTTNIFPLTHTVSEIQEKREKGLDKCLLMNIQ